MKRQKLIQLVLEATLISGLVGCSTPTTPTSISLPTSSSAVTSAPTVTPSPFPRLDPEIISPENVSQLAEKLILNPMSTGAAQGSPLYSLDGKWLYQASTRGIYAFDTSSYQQSHLLATPPMEMLVPDTETFSVLEALPGPVIYERSIFSPDRSLVAGYFGTNLTTVWHMEDRKLIYQFDGRPKEISPDNRLITIERTISYETYTRYFIDLYDLQTGEQVRSWESVRAFFLSDSRLVVESQWYIRVFDPQTRKVPLAFPGQFAAFSSDEQTMAVLYGNRIHVYRVSDGKLLHNLDGGLQSTDEAFLRFSANGEILAGLTTEFYCCAGSSHRLFVWSVSDGHLLTDLSRSESLDGFANPPFSLSPDGQAIVMNRQVLHTFDGSLIADLGTYFNGGTDQVTNLAFTPDGQQIIVARHKDLYLYSVKGEMLNMPQETDQEAYLHLLQPASGLSSDDTTVPSPAGKFFARRYLGVVTILNKSGEDEPFEIPLYKVRCLTFSPDGQILALGLPNGSVELWDVYNKQNIFTVWPQSSENSNPVGGLTFSPDGKLLAFGLEDGTVHLYGIKTK